MKIVKDILKFKKIISIPKNCIFYILGLVCYILIFHKVNYLTAFSGLLSFNFFYFTVYILNDISDLSEDKNNKIKKIVNPFASKKIQIEDANSLMFLFLILGFLFSIPLNFEFKIAVFLILFLNFFHSSTYTKHFTRKYGLNYVNIFLMQFIKISLGWFSQTHSLLDFPFPIAILISFICVADYYFFRKKIILTSTKEFLKYKFQIFLLLSLIIISYIFTFLFFPFKFLFLSISFLALILLYFLFKLGLNKVYQQKFLFSAAICLILILIFCFCLYHFSNIPQKFDEITNIKTSYIKTTIENTVNLFNESIKKIGRTLFC